MLILLVLVLQNVTFLFQKKANLCLVLWQDGVYCFSVSLLVLILICQTLPSDILICNTPFVYQVTRWLR
jgi:hypothetical protein